MSDARFPYASRTFTGTLQVRDADSDGRTIYGTVVPYGEETTVDDGAGPYREKFEAGAFARSIAQTGNKVRMYEQHNRSQLPIGMAVEWDDTPAALRGAFRLSSPKGDGALNLVRDGVVDAFSVGFRGIQARQDGDVTVRTEAAIVEVSLVATPAYASATVAGVRASDLMVDELERWLSELDPDIRAALALALAEGTGNPPDVAPPNWHGRTTYEDCALLFKQRGFAA
jgi:uncharacterized protein